MSWRTTLKHLLHKIRKDALVEGYIRLIETMSDDEEESKQIAREIHQLVKGDMGIDEFDEAFRKDIKKARAYIT